MKLYLIQHGQSLSKEVDPDCPLSDDGRQDVAAIGKFLAAANIKLDRVMHSTKTRAKQTAEILGGALRCESVEQIDGIKPMDDVQPIIAMVSGDLGADVENVAIVGHLPFMGKMVSALLSGNEDPVMIQYQQGSVCCLERSESTDNRWVLNWMVRPELVY